MIYIHNVLMSSDILLTTANSSAPATRTTESKFKIADGANRVFKLLSETSQPQISCSTLSSTLSLSPRFPWNSSQASKTHWSLLPKVAKSLQSPHKHGPYPSSMSCLPQQYPMILVPISVLARVTIAVIKCSDQSNLGKERVYFILFSQVIVHR